MLSGQEGLADAYCHTQGCRHDDLIEILSSASIVQAALADGRGEGRLRCLADACIMAGPSAGAEGIAAVQQWVALRTRSPGQHAAATEPPSAASPPQLQEVLQVQLP